MEHFFETIPGWFNYHSIYTQMVTACPQVGKFVEVGVYRGKSAAFMMVEIINSGKDISMDLIDVTDDFIQNLQPVAGRFTPITLGSPAAAYLYADNSLDFVWIDGDHSDQGIFRDITAWLPKVKVNGYLGGHDYDHPMHPGIRRVCNELLPGHMEIIPTIPMPPPDGNVTSWLYRKSP
jgi:hypothetical protein